MNKKLLMELRIEKRRLQKLALKKDMARRKAEMALKEEKKLKEDIAKLRLRTSNALLARARRRIKGVKINKKKAKELKNTFKKGFKEFQKFADKYGD